MSADALLQHCMGYKLHVGQYFAPLRRLCWREMEMGLVAT
jgi:hypothetical protein